MVWALRPSTEGKAHIYLRLYWSVLTFSVASCILSAKIYHMINRSVNLSEIIALASSWIPELRWNAIFNFFVTQSLRYYTANQQVLTQVLFAIRRLAMLGVFIALGVELFTGMTIWDQVLGPGAVERVGWFFAITQLIFTASLVPFSRRWVSWINWGWGDRQSAHFESSKSNDPQKCWQAYRCNSGVDWKFAEYEQNLCRSVWAWIRGEDKLLVKYKHRTWVGVSLDISTL